VVPFAWIQEFNDHFKDKAAAQYGEPPYGHAELSTLKAFAVKTGVDLTDGLVRLKRANIVFDSESQTLQQIARINKISPQQVYLAMKPDKALAEPNQLPPTPPPGTGDKKLNHLSREYNLSVQHILTGLADANIKAGAEMTIKQIAAQNEMAPTDVYFAVRKIAENQAD
jgi:hypothetical protein